MSPRRRPCYRDLALAIALVASGVVMSTVAHAQHVASPPRSAPSPAPRPAPRPAAPSSAPVAKPAPEPQRAVAQPSVTQPSTAQPPSASRVMYPDARPTPVQPSPTATRVPHPPPHPWEQPNTDIAPNDRPPPGMCRVWLNNVPASSQPAPTSCGRAIQMHPPNGRVIYGDDGRHPTAHRVEPAAPSPESSVPEPPPSNNPFADH